MYIFRFVSGAGSSAQPRKHLAHNTELYCVCANAETNLEMIFSGEQNKLRGRNIRITGLDLYEVGTFLSAPIAVHLMHQIEDVEGLACCTTNIILMVELFAPRLTRSRPYAGHF